MPAPISFTPRQLGQIASRLDGFTEARRANEKMRVPSTPDSFVCRFPCGHTGKVVWEQAPLSKAAAARNGGKPVYRYVVYLDATQRTAVDLDIPQDATTGDATSYDAHSDHARGSIRKK